MKRYTQEISLLQPEHSRETFQFIISKLSIQLVSWLVRPIISGITGKI